MHRNSNKGYSVVECLVTLAVFALLSAIVLPRLNRTIRRTALRAIAVRLTYVLMTAREDAITLEQGRGVRFFVVDGVWHYAVYEDGNNNGIRNSDIAAGIDRQIGLAVPLFSGTGFTPGIVAGIPDPDTGKPLAADLDPVNFNQSSICAFSSSGNGTPGSLYLTDNSGLVAAVRSSGSGGNVHALFYDGESNSWIR